MTEHPRARGRRERSRRSRGRTGGQYLPETEPSLDVRTHHSLDPRLCGTPVRLAEGEAEVRLSLLPEMAADVTGLVHGGFVFGLADQAAMLAVNRPTVVLAEARVRFSRPARIGEILVARARVSRAGDRRQQVEVVVRRRTTEVFRGSFTCLVLPRHVLDVR